MAPDFRSDRMESPEGKGKASRRGTLISGPPLTGLSARLLHQPSRGSSPVFETPRTGAIPSNLGWLAPALVGLDVSQGSTDREGDVLRSVLGGAYFLEPPVGLVVLLLDPGQDVDPRRCGLLRERFSEVFLVPESGAPAQLHYLCELLKWTPVHVRVRQKRDPHESANFNAFTVFLNPALRIPTSAQVAAARLGTPRA